MSSENPPSHKNLWTPWRMAYILGQAGKDDCIFDLAPGEAHSKKNLILRRDELTVTLLNRFPYANGHLLVAPARHVADLAELSGEEEVMLARRQRQAVTILRRHLSPHGFNIGLNLGEVAGAGLASHLHYHIVPRWEGDHNFITVTSAIRTIPQHIEATFDTLLADFQELD
ncbi:MAG: HIT domain-containing protein [Thermodesulfobacteriota bacterium]